MTEFKYGLFSSFLLFIWMIIEYTLLIPNYLQLGSYFGLVAVLIPVAGIYYGIKENKLKSHFGYITFNEAFKTGMIITAIISIMMMLFVYVYYEYINPEFVNYIVAETQKMMLENKASREEINVAVTIVRYDYSLIVQIIKQVLYILVGGTLTSLIFSALLKKGRSNNPD